MISTLKTLSEPDLIQNNRQFVKRICCLMAAAAILSSGCQQSPPAEFRFNEVEWIKQERLQLAEGQEFAPAYREQIGNLVTALFGTPDHPAFPNELGDPDQPVVNLEDLKMAAGAVPRDRVENPRGLYREHCAHCHGVSGDGAGPTAAFLNPYPRDFRLGKFKFKSTPLRQAPTDEDLVNILRNGIPGTAMPSFRTLKPQEIAALVAYVKYLTIRGQFERRLIAEIGSLEDAPLLPMDWVSQEPKNTGPAASTSAAEQLAARRKAFEDRLYDIVSGFLIDEGILERWKNAEAAITEVPPAPPALDFRNTEHQELVDSGKLLFSGKANCVQCHGETGMGDGQTENFDDWVNDWAKTSGIDPFNPATFEEFVKAGALPPRPIRPRNLRMPVLRGGSHPSDVYRRIANGIEGTPMPSSPSLSAEEIWALVAYVKSMPFESTAMREEEKPVNRQAVR
jgi:mono/diheme cytochrome c family protein